MTKPRQKRKNTVRDPTQEEIARRCLEVQATWDEATERSRRTGTAAEQPYEIPTVHVSEPGHYIPNGESLADYQPDRQNNGFRERNGEDSVTSKLTEPEVRDIFRRGSRITGHIGREKRKLATEFGVSVSCVHAIIAGKAWTHLRLHLEFPRE